MEKYDPSTIVVDAGNFSLNRDKIKQYELPKQRKTVELVLDAFSISPTPLVALGIGERDLMMGGEWLMTTLDERSLPHVLSNLDCSGLNFVVSREHSLDGISIEFLSFVSPSMLEKKPMGDLLTVSSMLPTCTAIEPAKWLLQNPKQVDIRVAFADLNRNELNSIAPYVDIVIESKIGKTTPAPEALDTDTVLFGVGSKGQNLGELSWAYEATKSGFSSGDARAAKERDLSRRRARLANLDEQRQELGEEDPTYKKLQRQYDYTQRSITQLEVEISKTPEVNGVVMEISSNLVSLNKDISNHAEMEKIIEKAGLDAENTEE